VNNELLPQKADYGRETTLLKMYESIGSIERDEEVFYREVTARYATQS
jgi:hypothetical protein